MPGLCAVDGARIWIGDVLRRPGHLLLTVGADASVVDRFRDLVGDLGTVVPVIPAAADRPG